MNNKKNRLNKHGNTSLEEKMRLIRFRMKREEFKFSKDIRLIPRRLVYAVICLFVVTHIIAQFVFWTVREPLQYNWSLEMNALALAGIVTFSYFLFAAVIFMVGYVNRDAKRRDMNSTLWTILTIVLLPAYLFVGFLVYFLIRNPLPFNCPECSTEVSARFNYCPNCKYNLRPACPQCNRELQETDRFCPYCATDLTLNPIEQNRIEESESPIV